MTLEGESWLHRLGGGTRVLATTDGSMHASGLGGDHLGWAALPVFLRIMYLYWFE